MSSLAHRAEKILKDTPDGKRFSWNFKQRKFAEHIIKDGTLKEFLMWPESRESLYTGLTDVAKLELEEIPEVMRYAAIDPMVGSPTSKMTPDGASGTYIRQLYVAYNIISRLMPIEKIEAILEFGGGYGALPVVMTRLGFDGIYNVYDFPIMNLIRDWYLAQLGLKTGDPIDYPYDIMVGVCSLDEAPLDRRELFLKTYFAWNYFFMVHKYWDDIDNRHWFMDWFISEGIVPRVLETIDDNLLIIYGSR